MNTLIDKLKRGQDYFGSGSYTTPEFNDFFEKFKGSLTRQFKHLKATDIEFSKGHFGMSGFFKIGEQYYYFSLSDVRFVDVDWYGNPKMLIRTAESNKDYSGGSNHYVPIKTQMYRDIASTFRITYTIPKKNAKIDLDKLVEKTVANKYLRRNFPSMKLANRFCWKLMEKLGVGNKSISYTKRGRYLVYSEFKSDVFNFRYDADSHTTEVTLANLTNEELIKTLDIPKTPQSRTNPFSGDTLTLEPLAVAVHDYVKKCERERYSQGLQQGIEIFASRWAEEYMILLD
jgi:hypothetical protein